MSKAETSIDCHPLFMKFAEFSLTLFLGLVRRKKKFMKMPKTFLPSMVRPFSFLSSIKHRTKKRQAKKKTQKLFFWFRLIYQLYIEWMEKEHRKNGFEGNGKFKSVSKECDERFSLFIISASKNMRESRLFFFFCFPIDNDSTRLLFRGTTSVFNLLFAGTDTWVSIHVISEIQLGCAWKCRGFFLLISCEIAFSIVIALADKNFLVEKHFRLRFYRWCFFCHMSEWIIHEC